jgi:hypothetical protein
MNHAADLKERYRRNLPIKIHAKRQRRSRNSHAVFIDTSPKDKFTTTTSFWFFCESATFICGETSAARVKASATTIVKYCREYDQTDRNSDCENKTNTTFVIFHSARDSHDREKKISLSPRYWKYVVMKITSIFVDLSERKYFAMFTNNPGASTIFPIDVLRER